MTRLLEEPDARHYVSRLSLVETVSAFAIKLRMRQIDDQGFEALRRRFYHDIGQGRLRLTPVTTARYQDAVQLIVRYVQRSWRTLDALQLAVALALSRRGMLDRFVCADQTLCETALAEGLTVINPRGQ